MPRPSIPLPDDFIAFLGRQGRGAPAIHEALGARGVKVDERTVGRRLERLRGEGWPGADAYAASQRPAKRSAKPEAEAAESRLPDASASPADAAATLAELDIERLPAELLVRASQLTFDALERALANGEIVAVDKLATVLDRFAHRLAEVRPPEKVEPVRDPTNVAARREILARWEMLREPFEVSMPLVEQMQAHVDALRARVAAAPERAPDAPA